MNESDQIETNHQEDNGQFGNEDMFDELLSNMNRGEDDEEDNNDGFRQGFGYSEINKKTLRRGVVTMKEKQMSKEDEEGIAREKKKEEELKRKKEEEEKKKEEEKK